MLTPYYFLYKDELQQLFPNTFTNTQTMGIRKAKLKERLGYVGNEALA